MNNNKSILDTVIFQSALEQVPASIVITDPTPKILYINKFFTEQTGYTEEEAKGKNPNILNSGTHSREFYQEMWQTLLSGNIWEGELRNLRKDGTYFWEKASIAPYFDDEGDIAYYVAVKHDITKEKEDLVKSKRRERYLNNIQELSLTGGWEYDIVNDRLFWTDQMYKIHGLEKSFSGDLTQESFRCIDEESRDRIVDSHRKCIREGISFDHTFKFTDFKGNKKWVRAKCNPIKSSEGKVIKVVGSFRDITVETDALHALKKRKSKLKAIVESFDDIVFTLDEEGRHIKLYGKWAKSNELSAMMLGKTDTEIFGKEEGKIHTDALQKAKEQGFASYNWHIEDKEGDKSHFEMRLTKLKGAVSEDSTEEKFLGVGRNITAEVNYQEELMDLKDRLNYALIGTKAGTWDWDIKSGKIILNERWATMLGYSLSELEPAYIETWKNFIHPKDLKRVENDLQNYFNGHTPMFDVKVRMQHKDGHWVWVLSRGASFEQDDKGSPTRMVGTHIDVTDWMKAEQRLKNSERKYRELFENSADPSLLEKSGLIVDCNRAALDLLGNDKKSELIGKNFAEISPQTQPDGQKSEQFFKSIFNELINQNKTGLMLEWEHLSKDGKIIPVESVITNLTDIDGDSIRYIVLRDITDRKAAEKEILESYEERGALLSEIHHRVKNNLAIISGLIQLQIIEVEDEKTVEQLNKSVNRIKSIALIHEQLYQSKSFSEISLKENIKNQVETLMTMYNSDISVNVDLKLDLDDVQININQALTCGLLLNEILNNAFKHAFKGRDTGQIQIKLKESGAKVCLTVRDNGVGISNEQESQESLGRTLIETFIQQLNAEAEVKTEEGTCYIIEFMKHNLKGVMASNLDLNLEEE